MAPPQAPWATPLKIPLNKGGEKPKASGGCPVSQHGQRLTRQPPKPKGHEDNRNPSPDCEGGVDLADCFNRSLTVAAPCNIIHALRLRHRQLSNSYKISEGWLKGRRLAIIHN